MTLPEQFLDELIKGKAEADAEIARLTSEGLANTKLFYQTMCAVRCLDASIKAMSLVLDKEWIDAAVSPRRTGELAVRHTGSA